ncbi:MAG: MarR family winged helix-turn-helix transcriptional regulator [Solirubrobacteraceae bacterium]
MTDEHRTSGATTVPRALGRLRVALDDSFTRASRKLGLSAQQAELLWAAMRPAAVSDIAHILRCDRSNVSRLVDRAERRGLLARQPGETDRRVTLIKLTPEGDRLAHEFIQTLESQLQPLLAQWSKARHQTAITILDETRRRAPKQRSVRAADRAVRAPHLGPRRSQRVILDRM